MVLKSREKVLIFLVLIAVAIWAFDHFYYSPQKKKISQLKEEINSADLRLKESPLFIQGVENMESEVSRLEKELQGLIERMLKGEESRALLKHLARDSDRLQMKLISLDLREESISPPEEEKATSLFQYRKVTALMVLNSTYSALEAYLKSIEELPFLVTVDHLQVERNNGTFPLLKVTMGLNVLVMSVSEGGAK
jgi:Tfp pilus assembly protein PilN